MKILVDHREKKPYQFPGVENVETVELNVGDYTLEGFEDVFAVERKTLDDLATSLGAERLRFENEIRRANGLAERNSDGNPIPYTKPAQALEQFVVVIESPRSAVYNYAGEGACPNYYSRIYPNSIIGTVESWPDKYETLEFNWSKTREQAKQETLRLLDKWYVQHSIGSD